MTLGIIGRKIGMTHQFDEKGNMVPVTVIQAGPCKVVQVKTEEKDRYNAIQMGYEELKQSRVNKPRNGHFASKNMPPHRHLKEVRLDAEQVGTYKEGDAITVEAFENCPYVDITGTSKGRGMTGVIKRYGFHMPKATHGTHEKYRHGGAIGCRFPQNVIRGKKMPGHSGNSQVTAQNLKVFSVRKEDNLILIRGSVPGPNNRMVFVRSALKKPPA
jgi:large subunit ribosomal protein L3